MLPTLDLSDRSELTFDYASDMGDAFDPTMQVAWTLGRSELTRNNGAPLPRAELLILGGDEVYPDATPKRYRRQLIEPYRHALEDHRDDEHAPTVLAIPGNHDWYGGLDHWRTAFYASDEPPPNGTDDEPKAARQIFPHWNRVQQTSWWSVKLPHGWWMWGIDTHTTGTINAEQEAFFENQADLLEPGDQVILVTPVPLWRLREKHPSHLRVIDDFVGRHIDAKGRATASVFLAGDFHVFASFQRRRYASGVLEHHVTSGGAGAFLHPTHNIGSVVPLTAMEDDTATERAPFVGGMTWPSRHDTHDITIRKMFAGARDRQSGSLTVLLGLLHLLFAWGAVWKSKPDDVSDGLRGLWDIAENVLTTAPGSWATLVALVLALALGVAFARPNTKEVRVVSFARKVGLLHGLVQFGVTFVTAVVAHWLVWHDDGKGWPADNWLPLALSALVAAVISVLVMLAYFRRVNRDYRINDNEAFSVRHYGDYKHFVRCHVDGDGVLTLRLVGIESVTKGWGAAIRDKQPLPPGSPNGAQVRVGTLAWEKRIERDVTPFRFSEGANRWVSLSISDPDPPPTRLKAADPAQYADELAAHDASRAQLTVVFKQLSEALLRAGCNVSYGGDDRTKSYSEHLAEVAKGSIGVRSARLRNYGAGKEEEPIALDAVEFVPIEANDNGNHDGDATDAAAASDAEATPAADASPHAPDDASLSEAKPDDAEQHKLDLTAMREQATEDSFARIVIGGKILGSKGRGAGPHRRSPPVGRSRPAVVRTRWVRRRRRAHRRGPPRR